MERLEALSPCAADSAAIDCQIVCISPPVVATSEWPSQLEVTCRVGATMLNPLAPNLSSFWKTMMSTSFSAYKWVMTADTLDQDGAWGPVAATSWAYSAASHAMETFVTLRFELPALSPGFKNIVVWPSPATIGSGPHAGLSASKDQLRCWPTAVNCGSAPLLVTPSAALTHELSHLFSHMEDLVCEEQLEQQAAHADRQQGNTSAVIHTAVSAAATECWTGHFKPLLVDIRNVLSFTRGSDQDTATAQPCSTSSDSSEQSASSVDPVHTAGTAAGHQLSSVMEFLAMHGCWCSVSYILAEAYKRGLLACPGVITAVQAKRSRILEQQGQAAYNSAAGVTTAMILSVASVAAPGAQASAAASALDGDELYTGKAGPTLVSKRSSSPDLRATPTPAASAVPSSQIKMPKSADTAGQQYSLVALLLITLLAAAALLWQSATQAICGDVVFNGKHSAADVPILFCLVASTGLLSLSAAFLSWRGKV